MPKLPTGNTGFAKHLEYSIELPNWTRCRDAAEGQQRIHAKRGDYLPRLSTMDESEYLLYLRRALFFNATARTATGLTGAVMRKPTLVEYPESMVDELEEIGCGEESVRDLIARTVHQQLLVGRVGHLVDAAPENSDADLDPFVAEYGAESIWNWRQEVIAGRKQLVLVVLHEKQEVPANSQMKFETDVRDRWRVLRLGNDPAIIRGQSAVTSEDGQLVRRQESDQLAEGFQASDLETLFYFQELWVRALDGDGKETDTLILEEVIVPRKSAGRLWEEIPFAFTNAATVEPEVGKPPLIDLVDVNLSHYMNSADLEWGRHFTALPTPWIAGGDPKEEVRIGSTIAWIIPEPTAKVGMLEFTGAGLGHLQQGMEHKEKMMAVLGSRLLEDQKAGVEAAAAIKLRLTGDGATLTAISMTASESWTSLLAWIWEWTNVGDPPDVAVTVNSDFNPARLPPDEMAALMLALQAGRIDFPTWYYNLERGDMLPPGTSIESFTAEILKGAPGDLDVPDDVEKDLTKDDDADDQDDA